MRRELSSDKNVLSTDKTNRKTKSTTETKVGENKNSIPNDLITTMKNKLQEVFKKDENIKLKSAKQNFYKINKETNFNKLINSLDKDLFDNEYKNYLKEIEENLKEFKSKPKYYGINLTCVNKNTLKEEIIIETNIDKLKNKICDLNNFSVITNANDTNKYFDVQKIKDLQAITDIKLITPFEIFYKHEYEKFHKISNELDKCSICLIEFYDELFEKAEKKLFMKNLTINDNNVLDLPKSSFEEILKFQISNNYFDVIILEECNDHFFHLDCISNMTANKQDYIKCPNCSIIYGEMKGDQPPGSMKVVIDKKVKCQGYKKNNTIIINYYFPNGNNYQGTSRTVFLPDNQDGREILALFRIAFERKLLFTIGTSITTGKSNQTIWNGVHQKTNISGGPQYFGYPDETYFNRVKQELAAKGVTKDHIEKKELLSVIADKFVQEKIFCNI